MTTSRLRAVLHGLSRFEDVFANEPGDADLLDRFRGHGDAAALTTLVRRHGPLVLGVCRRVLGNGADVDDAFQATFLVLIRKAGSIRRGESLGSWLYGVAHRVAVKARARRVRPTLSPDAVATSGRDPVGEASHREVAAILDEEIRALPAKYRTALVLCGLGGRTCEQAARELGWPKSTLGLRLSRARELLRGQLGRRGIAVPAALAAVLAGDAAAASVPAALLRTTVRLARQPGAASERSAAGTLAEQVVRQTAVPRRAVALILAALGLAAAAAGLGEGPKPADTTLPASTPAQAGAGLRKDREGFPLPAEALARVGSARLRLGRALDSLGYSPDGTLLAAAGSDVIGETSLLRVWDTRTGRAVWQCFTSPVNYGCNNTFSANGDTIVLRDGTTCRWFDACTGRPLPERDFKLPDGSRSSRFGPHGATVAVISHDQTEDLVVYDLPSGAERFRKAADGFSWLHPPVFSADGNTLAVLEDSKKPGEQYTFGARLFDLKTGQQTCSFRIGYNCSHLALSSDGRHLATAGGEWPGAAVFVRSVPDGKLLHELKADVYPARSVAFTPDGKSVVIASHTCAARLDLATGQESGRYRTRQPGRHIAFTPDGKRLATGLEDGSVIQWDLATGKRLEASADLVALGSLHFDATGRFLLHWDDNAVVTKDWRSGRQVRRVRVPFEGELKSVSLAPDLSRVAGGHGLWSAASGEEMEAPTTRALTGTWPWRLKAFSPDGKTIYFVDLDGQVCAWDAEHGRYLFGFLMKEPNASGLAVSADGRQLAVAQQPPSDHIIDRQDDITVWDTGTQRRLRRFTPPKGDEVKALAFSPDGNYLVAVGDAVDKWFAHRGFLEVWDTRTGTEWRSQADLPDALVALTFSRDGRTLAVGSERGALTLWEFATRHERHRFSGHENAIQEVTFSRDNKYLASTSCDAPIFVWDVEGHDGSPPSVVPFTGDEAASLWQALDDANASAAFDAMRQLLARPGPAVTLLRERLKPAPAVDEADIRQHLRDLDADAFATRERAAAALETVADRVKPALQATLEAQPSAEAARRVRQILQSSDTDGPRRRREIRAAEVAERINSPEARELLAVWGRGATGALLTSEARAALARIVRR